MQPALFVLQLDTFYVIITAFAFNFAQKKIFWVSKHTKSPAYLFNFPKGILSLHSDQNLISPFKLVQSKQVTSSVGFRLDVGLNSPK